MNANELRELVINKNKPKQDKYMIKLRKKIDNCGKRGYSTYMIQSYYMPKWFDFEFECRIISELEKDGYSVLGKGYTIIIGW